MDQATKYRIVYYASVVIVFLLCLPMAGGLSVTLPLLSSTTRAEALVAMKKIRMQGRWASRAVPLEITTNTQGTCILWDYAYRSRSYTQSAERFTTCSYE